MNCLERCIQAHAFRNVQEGAGAHGSLVVGEEFWGAHGRLTPHEVAMDEFRVSVESLLEGQPDDPLGREMFVCSLCDEAVICENQRG